MEHIEFFKENWLMITVVFTLIIYRKKMIWEPLSGGNGHLSMDECAKALLLAVFAWGVWKEGTRSDLSQRVFDDTFFLILVSAVFAIANISVSIDINQLFRNKPTEPK